MTIDGGTVVSISLLTGLLMTGIAAFGYYAFLEVTRKGKARIMWWDPDGGPAKLTFHEIVNGNEIQVGKGDKGKRYILEGSARIPARYPTWIIHPRHGWNLTAPTDKETVNSDVLLQKLSISTPALYHFAIAKNKARDALRANDEDDKWGWVMPVAIVGLCALVVILVAVIFVAYKVSSATSGGPAS